MNVIGLSYRRICLAVYEWPDITIHPCDIGSAAVSAGAVRMRSRQS